MVSLSQDTKYEDTFESTVFGKKDKYFKKDITFDELLKKNLTNGEISILTMGIQKSKSKVKSKVQKQCADFGIEVLSDGTSINVKGLTKQEFATMLGITRPTLNRRIEEVTDKAIELAKKFGLIGQKQ